KKQLPFCVCWKGQKRESGTASDSLEQAHQVADTRNQPPAHAKNERNRKPNQPFPAPPIAKRIHGRQIAQVDASCRKDRFRRKRWQDRLDVALSLIQERKSSRAREHTKWNGPRLSCLDAAGKRINERQKSKDQRKW